MPPDISILEQPESGKLDFKESYGFMLPRPLDVDKREWSKYVDGQWDEFSKDVIALCNGDLSSPTTSAFIVIGVREDGESKIITGIDGLNISKMSILQRLNNACLPAITDVLVHYVGEEKKICIIEIPYTSQIIESSREFRTTSLVIREGAKVCLPKATYSKHCVFYRVGDTTDIASLAVKNFLSYSKSEHARFKIERLIDEIERNLQKLTYKNGKGYIVSPIGAFRNISNDIDFKFDGNNRLSGQQMSLLFVYSMIASTYSKNYDHRMLDSVLNDVDLYNYIELNYEDSNLFFRKLLEFGSRHIRLIRTGDNYLEEALRMSEQAGKHAEYADISARTVLHLSTYLARIHDLAILYIGMLQYLKGNPAYLRNTHLAPLYIAKSESGKGENEAPSLEQIREFVDEELGRE